MFYLKLYFLFYEKLYFLIKFYKNVGDGTGRGKPHPIGDGGGVYIYTPSSFGAGVRKKMGSQGRGWDKQNPAPPRPVAMPKA